MTRVLSGILLAAAFFTIVWFSSAPVLLVVALGVCVLACIVPTRRAMAIEPTEAMRVD